MATNKKAISAYLSSELEEYLTRYCTEYDITRKDKSGGTKPALGTAVVEILRRFFSDENVPSPLPDNVPLLPSNVITEDRLKEALSELENSSNVIGNLPSNILTQNELDKRLGNLDARIETRIDRAIPGAIANLKNDGEFIGAIALEVQKITSKDALEQAEIEEDKQISTQVDKASLAPIFEEVEESEPEKLLSKKEAFAVALSRGYKSGDTAFAQWFRDHKGGTLHGIKKHRGRGKYIDVGEQSRERE